MNKLLLGTLILGLTFSIACGSGGNSAQASQATPNGASGSTSPVSQSSTPAQTTLAAETSNNTSAASSFPGWADGNIAPTNVSKVDVHNLLYPGTTAKVYAHLMPWFGNASHRSVGYTSWSATQVALQVNDMISRGINGMVIDWYGPANVNLNTTTQLIFQEAVKHPGFEVAVMLDAGGLVGDPTTWVVSSLNYIQSTYQTSPAYMRKDGRPVDPFFGVEALAVNWATVQSSVGGNPVYVFENANGFTLSDADGAFSWVGTFDSPDDWGQAYLDNFYATALTHPPSTPSPPPRRASTTPWPPGEQTASSIRTAAPPGSTPSRKSTISTPRPISWSPCNSSPGTTTRKAPKSRPALTTA